MTISGSSGGVVASVVLNDGMSIVSSKQCRFEGNSGGVYILDGPHQFYSEYNRYSKNSGSILSAGGIHTNMVITGDRIWSNTANSEIVGAGGLSNINMSNVEFENNTSGGPTVYIRVTIFSCMKCIFSQNIAEIEGIVTIVYADKVILNSLQAQNNNVHLPSRRGFIF